jgi:hypothetical protein
VFEPHPGQVREVQRQVADDDLVGGGAAQLVRQAVVVEPDMRIRLPCVLDDRCGLAEALREARRADLSAEHTGSRGLWGRRAILAAVVAPAPSWVVAYHRPRLRIAHPAGIDDVAGVTILGLSARVKDLLPDRHSTLVGRLPRRTACVNRRFRTLPSAVIPRAALLATAGRQALDLLYGRLVDERLRLAVQVLCLKCRGGRHGP